MRAAELADTTSSAAVQITPARVPFHGGVRAAPFRRGIPAEPKRVSGVPGPGCLALVNTLRLPSGSGRRNWHFLGIETSRLRVPRRAKLGEKLAL